MISEDTLREMSREERAALSRQIAALDADLPSWESGDRRRRRFVLLLSVVSIGFIPWIVLLAVTLPHRYVAGHWTLTWVGFDVVLLAGLAATAWLAWARRQAVVVAAFTTATLLICDAWFDVLTARTAHELEVAITMAVLAEGPLALVCIWVARNSERVDVWAKARGQR